MNFYCENHLSPKYFFCLPYLYLISIPPVVLTFREEDRSSWLQLMTCLKFDIIAVTTTFILEIVPKKLSTHSGRCVRMLVGI
jgi:hypothetical protein